MKQLDTVDRQILHLLQDNAKYTIKEIATQLGMTTTPVYERIKRMEEDGYIDSYVALLNKGRLGLGLVALCKISLKEHSTQQMSAFEEQVQSCEEAVECYQTAGDFDYILKLILPDMDAYQQFMNTHINGLANVKMVRSSFVMKEVKCSTQLHF
ncbi:MAG TPA: Lrp/AsnC family transcriptional regulator [Saprospiraceae bacterium]|nr:Lrp/AsnC family transcriptional regulator [Saprospiraceae bacterium]